MRDHQQGHVDNRDHVGRAQLTCELWKSDFTRVVIVEDEIEDPYTIERHDAVQKTGPTLTAARASMARIPVVKSQ